MGLWGVVAALVVLALGFYSELPIDYRVLLLAVLAGVLLSSFGFLLVRNLKKVLGIFTIGEKLDAKAYSISEGLVIVAAMLIVYTLGVGPVAAITKRGWIRVSTFKQVYAPILWLDDHTLLKKPIEAYAKFWGLP